VHKKSRAGPFLTLPWPLKIEYCLTYFLTFLLNPARPSRLELRRSRVAGSGTATGVEEDSDEPVFETPAALLVLPSSRHPTKRERIVRAKIESFIKFFITVAPFFNTFIISEAIGSY